MPTVLETAKEATYAAVGLQVLFLDELNERFEDQRTQLNERFEDQRTQLNERFEDQRTQLNEQLDLAREHGQKARDRVQPLAARSWDAAESTVTRISELAPAPFDNYVTEGFARMRDAVGVEAEEAAKPEAKKAQTKKAPAAKKTTTRKAAAKKTTRKAAAK